ncbi:MAG: FmdE family protein [Gordonibacter sp.]|nr:FmdE family protein [Gordonibacter sp.]
MLNKSLWDKAAEFHGHTCPGLAIGFKACEGAIAELGLNAEQLPAVDEEIVCVTENDACGVDAVQVLLGCTYGKANLIPRLRGKMAFSFFIRGTDRKVRLMLEAKNEGDMGRQEFQDYLLKTPYDQLFKVSKPNYDLPESARLFASHTCAICGESAAEYGLRVQGGNMVCIDCYDAYEREGF